MKRPQRLSATFIRTVKLPNETPRRFGDGRGGFGLSLLVKPMASGGLSKSFSQRLRIHGKPFNIGIGPYPLVTLAEAREIALDNARAVRKGIDIRREQKPGVPSFSQAADTVIAMHAKDWKPNSKSEAQWRSSLKDYALPILGDMSVSDIQTPDVMAVLTPIWSEKRETANRVRQRMSAIMDWAITQNYRTDNPVSPVLAALPKANERRKHFRALPYAEVHAALATINASDAWVATKDAIQFLTLTATRSGEVRGAMWDEIDGDVWAIPASRMKGNLDHRVPLSRQAIEVLNRAREYQDTSGLIFPSVRRKMLSDNTLSKLFRELQVAGTPHGMRSAFRDWAAEKSGVPREICEFALAHVEGSAAELAYRRTDYFDARRGLMQAWADYIA